MDREKSSSSQRKMKFAPKAPKRRQPNRVKDEVDEEAREAAEAENLRKRLTENPRRDKAKVERKVEVAFGPGAIAQPFTQATYSSKDDNGGRRCSLGSRVADSVIEQQLSSVKLGQISDQLDAASDSSDSDMQDQEHWDYNHTYYPTTLPWRRPYSGNPDILDEIEFRETKGDLDYDESTINDAAELGFLDLLEEKAENPKLMFFQFPGPLPVLSTKQTGSAKGKGNAEDLNSHAVKGATSNIIPGPTLALAKQKVGAKGKEIAENSNSQGTNGATSSTTLRRESSSLRSTGPEKLPSLDQFPAGHMGKLLVYKSGAVKLKLGEDLLFDVSAGIDCSFAQEVAIFDTKDKHCCSLGQVGKRAVVTPNFDVQNNLVQKSDVAK